MTADERRHRVLALVDHVINSHDPAAISRFTSNPGIEGTVRSLLEAFPDLHFDVRWTVAEGDRVVAFVEMSGTQEGPWLMVRQPTHRPMSASLMLGLQLDDDNMIVDSWLGTNFIAMLAQLGWGVAPIGETVPGPGPGPGPGT
jgi:predicted ester cyclase